MGSCIKCEDVTDSGTDACRLHCVVVVITEVIMTAAVKERQPDIVPSIIPECPAMIPSRSTLSPHKTHLANGPGRATDCCRPPPVYGWLDSRQFITLHLHKRPNAVRM